MSLCFSSAKLWWRPRPFPVLQCLNEIVHAKGLAIVGARPRGLWLFSLVTMWPLTTSSDSGFSNFCVNQNHGGSLLKVQILRPARSDSAGQSRDPGICIFTGIAGDVGGSQKHLENRGLDASPITPGRHSIPPPTSEAQLYKPAGW